MLNIYVQYDKALDRWVGVWGDKYSDRVEMWRMNPCPHYPNLPSLDVQDAKLSDIGYLLRPRERMSRGTQMYAVPVGWEEFFRQMAEAERVMDAWQQVDALLGD